jgi:hypothetical protein
LTKLLCVLACILAISISLMTIGLSNRYKLTVISVPSFTTDGVDQILARIDSLTGEVCMSVGNDGYTYYELSWNNKLNHSQEIKSVESNVMPPQCEN